MKEKELINHRKGVTTKKEKNLENQDDSKPRRSG
jgi:hypothetical protein